MRVTGSKYKALLFILSSLLFFASATYADATKSNCQNLLEAPTQKTELRLLTYNLKNFSVKSAKKKNGGEYRLGLKRIEEIGLILNELDADILVLEEISSFDDLLYLKSEALDTDYNVYFFEGNTEGSSLGFLVRRSLPFRVETKSYSDRSWVDPTDKKRKRVFTRDAPVLTFLSTDNQAVFSVMGLHLKSMKNRSGDEFSRHWRTAEVKEVTQIVDETAATTQAPVFVLGDFNCDLHLCPENQVLLQSLTDSWDLLSKPPSKDVRDTHVYFRRTGPDSYDRSASQLDAVLVSNSRNVSVQDVRIFHYNANKDEELPETIEDRENQPSDHFPLYTDITINH